MKRCTKCKHNVPNAGFHTDRSAPDGRCQDCKVCRNHAVRATRQLSWDRDAWMYLFRQKRSSAGRASLPFTLTEQWLTDQPKFCPYLGLAFVLEAPGSGQPHQLSPTFDQIVAGAGYTPENTRLVSWWANRAKGDMDDSEFRDHCLMVEENIGGRFD